MNTNKSNFELALEVLERELIRLDKQPQWVHVVKLREKINEKIFALIDRTLDEDDF